MDLGRKISGAKYHARKKKSLYERKSQERQVILGETKRKTIRVRGGNKRIMLLKSEIANILVDGKIKPAKIVNVEATPQNTFLARQNRLMKGAIIETSIGKAKITNRPTREGMVNAILLK